MTDSQAQPSAHKDEQEKYLIRSAWEINQVLTDLAKRPELITAYFDDGAGYILSTIIAVLNEQHLVVMEKGPDEQMNQRLLHAGRARCISKQRDVSVRFYLDELREAKYQGQMVFAAKLPESLYRLQRREYFRVHTPLSNPLLSRIKTRDGTLFELALSDLSVGGLAMLDPNLAFEAEVGEVFEDCSLVFPEETVHRVNLKIRNIFLLGEERHRPQLKIGCSFDNVDTRFDSFIHRYVNRLQIQQNSLHK